MKILGEGLRVQELYVPLGLEILKVIKVFLMMTFDGIAFLLFSSKIRGENKNFLQKKDWRNN